MAQMIYVNITEMQAVLSVIINIRIIPLRDIKDYWSKEIAFAYIPFYNKIFTDFYKSFGH